MADLVEIQCDLRFESAHLLPNVPEGHKCRRLHGHSYVCRLTVRGPLDPQAGWVMDFAEVKAAAEPVREALDHRYLNEVEGLENPTAEYIAKWIWERLAPRLPGLVSVGLRETCTARCVYRGPAA